MAGNTALFDSGQTLGLYVRQVRRLPPGKGIKEHGGDREFARLGGSGKG